MNDTDTNTNPLALPYLQPYRRVTALALAYLALVEDMTGDKAETQQVTIELSHGRRHVKRFCATQ